VIADGFPQPEHAPDFYNFHTQTIQNVSRQNGWAPFHVVRGAGRWNAFVWRRNDLVPFVSLIFETIEHVRRITVTCWALWHSSSLSSNYRWVWSTQSQKSMNYFKIVGARKVTWSKTHSEDPQMWGAAVQNVVPWQRGATSAFERISIEVNYGTEAWLPELVFLCSYCHLDHHRLHHQVLLHLLEHRAFMKSFQALRSPAIPLASFHVLPVLLISSSVVLRHVLFGLPLRLYPWGVQSNAVFSIAPASLRNVCPIQFHLLLFILFSVGFCWVILHSSSFVILSVHFIFIIRLKHLLTNICVTAVRYQ
jgi:hypothetical protein